MIRKWMTTLLAMLLAMMLPMYAIADTQHTLTIIPGDELAAEQAVADLFGALALKLTHGEESGALTISLSGTDLLTGAVSADVTGLYVHSNILSDDVLYVTWDDGFAVISQLAAAEMDAASAEAFQQSMEQSKQAIVSAMQAGIQSPAQVVTTEESIAAVEEMFKDDPGMVEYVKSVYDDMVTEQGEFADPQRDTATSKQTMIMTGEDLVAICDTNYMRTIVEEVIAAEQPELQGEELVEAVDAMLDEIRAMYRDMDMTATVTVYTVDDGLTLVGMEMTMPMTLSTDYTDENGQAQSEEYKVNMTMNYDRLTDANGVSHKADMNMDMGDDMAMEMVFDLYKGADGVSKGSLAMLAGGEEVTFLYNASNAGDVRTRQLDLYLRSGANAIIEPAASARPLIGFKIVTEPADPAVLSKIESADSHNAVNVMKLSDEEMTTLLSDIEVRAMQIVYNAMASLPTSMMTLLMEMSQ